MNDEELEDLLKPQSEESFMEEMKNRWILQPQHVHFPKKSPVHDEQGITLYTDTDSEYFIDWYRIQTPIDCLLYIHHLCDKNWINRNHVKYILTYAGLRFKWGYLAHRTPFEEYMDQIYPSTDGKNSATTGGTI